MRFIRPEPRITIEESEPNILIERGQASVDIAAASEADIRVTQEDAVLKVDQAEGADVSVAGAESPAEVNVVDGGEAEISVQQGEADVRIENFNADQAGVIADRADRQRYRDMAATRPIFALNTDDLVGRNVLTMRGEDVGEIDFVGRRGDTLVAIVGVGGFLGMGENNVAVPIDQVALVDGQVVLPERTQAELERMPEFNENEVVLPDPGIRLADALNLD